MSTGFVNYHAMTDRPEDMDRNTFQETGDNMLAEVKHFGNVDIRSMKGGEKTFFNAVGGWMITYPVSWNMLFLVLVHGLLVGWVIAIIVQRRIVWKALLAGFLGILGVLVLEYFVVGLALSGVRAAYPLYSGYYSNAYNSGYFYLAAIALAVALFTFVFAFLLRRFELSGLMMGVFVLEVIVLDVLYGTIPTAIYFLCFPLLFVLAGCLFRRRRPLVDFCVGVAGVAVAGAVDIWVVYRVRRAARGGRIGCADRFTAWVAGCRWWR